MHQLFNRSIQSCMLHSSTVLSLQSQSRITSLKYKTFSKQPLIQNYKACISYNESLLKVSSLNNFSQKKFYTNPNSSNVKAWALRFAKQCDKWIEQVSPSAKKFIDELTAGAKRTWSDIQTYRFVKKRLKVNPMARVSYSEEMKIFFLKEDAMKVAPLIPFCLIPFGFVLLFIPIYFFPRYVLPHSFYTESQQKSFYSLFHKNRLKYYNLIVHHMSYHKDITANSTLVEILDGICSAVNSNNIPSNSLLLRLKPFCSDYDSPFNIELRNVQLLLQSFAKVFRLNSYLPSKWLSSQLRSHGLLLLRLDKKLQDEKILQNLSDKDIRAATIIRGLNSAELSIEANVYWLKNWLDLTKHCDMNDYWFILHAAVLLSFKYSELKYQRRVFD